MPGICRRRERKITGSSVAFVANFAPCANTMTAWKGSLSGSTITTDWELWSADSDGNFRQIKDQAIFTKIN